MRLAITDRERDHRPMQTAGITVEIGRRLKATRTALGLSGTEFAARARLQQNAYSQYETGARMLSLAAAMRLCEAHRLTLDWLYRGDISGLPYDLVRRLGTLPGHSAGPQP